MKENVFEKTINDLDAGLSRDYLPKRLDILAKAFAYQWNAEQVDQALTDADCERLYARSSFEASLIFAFDHGISYQKWKELYGQSRQILEGNSQKEGIFKGGKITLQQLKQYVFESSDHYLHTQMVTRLLAEELKNQHNEQDFFDFMADNSMQFSEVREAARYYFCKYIYFYIREKSENYYKACSVSEEMRRGYGGASAEERGMQEKFALEELTFLKPLTKLRKEADKVKAGMSVEEKKEYLENAALTPGGIFDEFNYYYFGYVSTDWIEVLFELYDDFEEWSDQDKRRIARGLGLYTGAASEEEIKSAVEKLGELAMEERAREEAADEDYSSSGEKVRKTYQRGRVGEDYFRDFILGRKDINRETLIFFILFVNARIKLDEDNTVTIPRLNRILLNCGMAQLRPDRDFDQFVLRYIKANNPTMVVEEEVEKLVTNGRDFYLFQVYKDAYCHQNELLKFLI